MLYIWADRGLARIGRMVVTGDHWPGSALMVTSGDATEVFTEDSRTSGHVHCTRQTQTVMLHHAEIRKSQHSLL